jgi:hypothetical protein
MRLVVDSLQITAITARPDRETALGLYRGVVARWLQEFVDRGEIRTAEAR